MSRRDNPAKKMTILMAKGIMPKDALQISVMEQRDVGAKEACFCFKTAWNSPAISLKCHTHTRKMEAYYALVASSCIRCLHHWIVLWLMCKTDEPDGRPL